MARRKPGQLSGGQQQRVAVGRALINQPDVLLLDEPLGALDLKLRRQMQIELKRIQTEVGITFVHVTHDQEEAMTMADTIAVMNEGRIEQMGSPVEIYETPRTAFVANFLGQSNLFAGTVQERGADTVTVLAHGLTFRIPAARVATDGASVIVGVRPEKVTIRRAGAGVEVQPGLNSASGVVSDASFTGMSTQYLVRAPWGQELQVFAQNLTAEEPIRLGDDVVLTWEPIHTFGLDGSQDVTAGMDKELLDLGLSTLDDSLQVGG
jgi:spermidine/putrescine transport system ATP-binding protein